MKSLVEQITDLKEKLTENEETQAAILLAQAEAAAKQSEQDEVLAELLLQGLGVSANV